MFKNIFHAWPLTLFCIFSMVLGSGQLDYLTKKTYKNILHMCGGDKDKLTRSQIKILLVGGIVRKHYPDARNRNGRMIIFTEKGELLLKELEEKDNLK